MVGGVESLDELLGGLGWLLLDEVCGQLVGAPQIADRIVAEDVADPPVRVLRLLFHYEI